MKREKQLLNEEDDILSTPEGDISEGEYDTPEALGNHFIDYIEKFRDKEEGFIKNALVWAAENSDDFKIVLQDAAAGIPPVDEITTDETGVDPGDIVDIDVPSGRTEDTPFEEPYEFDEMT